jgi:Fe-S-cluster containining protein
MDRLSRFSYDCKACGRCCRDKVITLSPYDVIRIAEVAGITPAAAVARYTIRRGSVLKFADDGGCIALDGARCTVHRGRPLACRLYPLGLERASGGVENFVRLDPAPGSLGVYGESGPLQAFLDAQGVDEYLATIARYRPLVLLMRARIETLVDFETVEPREFWRRATREALAESNFDPNPLIDALFDPDRLDTLRDSAAATVDVHLVALEQRILTESDPAAIAAAAVILAVSLGFSPAEAIGSR